MAENNNTLLEKLDGLVARFEEVSTLITDPNVIADQKRYVKLTKEYKDLNDIMKARREYIQCLNGLEEAKQIMTNESDPEMKEMAREEANLCEVRIPELEEEIKLLLVPADPQDDRNAILEIRGGTGGDEAAIFAGDLFRMYSKYCETKGWKLEVSSANEGAAGGFKEIICSVTGDKVYGTLKYESGVHRVQRVPATETQGRVHTSAASVAVLPEAEPFDVEINEGEIKWDTFRSGGAGGQNVNKVESDWSAASYWYEIMALSKNAEIELLGLFKNSLQGDAAGAKLFAQLGVGTTYTKRGVVLKHTGNICEKLVYNFVNEPDLAQTFVVTCVLLNIPFRFTGLQSLKIKETDRIEALKTELRKLGYVLTDRNDSILEWNGERREPESHPVIATYEDHRMALSFAPAALVRPEGIEIAHPQVVSKSYPHYWEDLKAAGFSIRESAL